MDMGFLQNRDAPIKFLWYGHPAVYDVPHKNEICYSYFCLSILTIF